MLFLLFLQSLGYNYGGVLGLLFQLKKLTQFFCDFWVLVLHKTLLGVEPKQDVTWKKKSCGIFWKFTIVKPFMWEILGCLMTKMF
jgi:hypothetical protein